MKAIQFDRYGPPHEVCHCIEVTEPNAPGPFAFADQKRRSVGGRFHFGRGQPCLLDQ